MAGIRECGFDACTPIQAKTLPLTLAGRDVAGQAQTGTGKTAAFLIACFHRLLTAPPRPEEPFRGYSHPRALIIAPTRELAVQIEGDALRLGQYTGLRMVAVYGGVDYEKQRNSLGEEVDVLIGTPGRLIDFLKQKSYSISRVEVLVIDEADRMFDMGFIDDLRFMMRRLPPYQKRLSMLFSATLSYRAQELSYEYMNSPEILTIQSDTRTVSQVRQQGYYVESRRKISLMLGILRRDLAGEESTRRVMVFINTKRMGERLQRWLAANHIHCGYLSGDVPQTKRLKVLQRFQAGELPVLIATDVAGRGLHIDGVTHVINYDLPDNAEDYVHRVGRTARAGAEGDAISLVDEDGAYNLEAIEAYAGIKIPSALPPDDLFISPKPPDRQVVEEEDEEEEGMRRPPRRDGRGGSRDGRGGGRPSGRGGSSFDSRTRRPAPAAAAAAKPDNPTETAAEAPVAGGEPRRRPPRSAAPVAAAGSEGGAPAEGGDAPRKRRRRRRKPAGEGGAPETPISSGE